MSGSAPDGHATGTGSGPRHCAGARPTRSSGRGWWPTRLTEELSRSGAGGRSERARTDQGSGPAVLRVYLGDSSYGLIVVNDVVVVASPGAGWTVGKTEVEVVAHFRSVGGTTVVLGQPNPS
jgi:hypothetical protein